MLSNELQMNRHGVERVLDFVRDAGHQRFDSSRSHCLGTRRQLLPDGVERFAEPLELIFRRQIDGDAGFPAPESHQAAAEHVNRTKDASRQYETHESGDA